MLFSSLRIFAVAVFCSFSPAALAGFTPDLSADLKALAAAPNQAEIELVSRIADTRKPEALQGLLEAYSSGATPYVQRAILRALPRFDDVSASYSKALEKLVDVAVGESMRELREEALESLASCPKNGHSFLRMIVDSPAEDELRERALQAYISLQPSGAEEWYERLYKKGIGSEELQSATAKAKPKKGAEPVLLEAQPLEVLRPPAFDVIAGDLDIAEIRVASEDRNSEIRVRALEELYLRGEKKIDKLAKKVFENRMETTDNRVLGAKFALELVGPKFAKAIAKEAVRGTTPKDLRDSLANLLADSSDPVVIKLIAKGFGKGKAPAKLFYLVAAVGHWTSKFEKPLLSMLGDKEPAVARAAAKFAVSEGVKSAGPAVKKLFEKAEEPADKARLLPGLGYFQEDKDAWRKQLVELASSPENVMRNAALALLGGLGRESLDVLVASLDHPLWSTRLVAMHALEELAIPASVGEIIKRFSVQTGRMKVEFADSLFRMTGQPFGARHQPWMAWWEKEGKDGFKVPSASELRKAKEQLEIARLKETTGARFFGIRIISERVLFIIDVSGSMDEPTRSRYVGERGMPRIAKAREELLASLDALNPKSFFNIVPFSGVAYAWKVKLVQWAPDTLEEAREFVSKLSAGGGTNLIDSLFLALEDPDVDTIFLLSDGEPTAGPVTSPKLIRAAVRQANQNRGVVIHSIAIGTSLKILEWLAEDTGGLYRSFP